MLSRLTEGPDVHLPWRPVTPGGGIPPISTSLLEEEADELRKLAAGRRVLEIGSAHGYSACVMALAGAQSVTAVDPHSWIPGSLDSMQANVAALPDPSVVRIVQAHSNEALAALKEQDQRFGLIFIDGDHSYGQLCQDIDGSMQVLGEPGSVLAIHDYAEVCCCPQVAPAVDDSLRYGHRVVGSLWIKEC